MTWRGVWVALATAALVGGCVSANHAVVTVSTSIPVATTTPVTPSIGSTPDISGGNPANGTTGQTLYVSPDGLYQMRTDPAWSHVDDAALHIQFWFTQPAAVSFHPNVNIVEQPAAGVTLAEYLQISRTQVAQLGMSQVQFQNLELPHNTPGALMSYRGGAIGNGLLEYLAVMFLTHGTAVLATFTAPIQSFPAASATVEPYLKTLGPVT